MARKLFVVLSPFEEQALIKLAAELGVSELYALRYAVIEYLYSRKFIEEPVRNALLCKFMDGPENSLEAKVREFASNLEPSIRLENSKKIPASLRRNVEEMERRFTAACRLLLDGKLDSDEIEYWRKKAERFSFLKAARHYLELIKKWTSLMAEAPSRKELERDEVRSYGEEGPLSEDVSGRCSGSAEHTDRGGKQEYLEQESSDQPVVISIRPLLDDGDEEKEWLLEDLASKIQRGEVKFKVIREPGQPPRFKIILNDERFSALNGYRGCEITEEDEKRVLIAPSSLIYGKLGAIEDANI